MADDSAKPKAPYYKQFLVALAGVAMLAFAAPQLGIFIAYTIIGIPVAVAFWCAPALLFAVAIFGLFHRVLSGRGSALRIALGLAATAVLLALPPVLLNIDVERRAKDVAFGDHNDLILPVKARSVALRRLEPDHPGEMACNGFCLHALLSGAFERVLVPLKGTISSEPDRDDKAVEFRFKRQPVCDPTRLTSGLPELKLPQDRNSNGLPADPVDLANLRISDGECLIRRETTLAEADFIISQGRFKTGTTEAEARFDTFADTVSATRFMVHVRDQSGSGFREVYRQTEVRYLPFGPVMLPVLAYGQKLHMSYGWWRVEKTINVPRDFPDGRDLGTFLAMTLSLPLSLDGKDMRRRITGKIEQAIAAGRSPTPAEWEAYSKGFGRAALRGQSINAYLTEIEETAQRDRLGKAEFDLAVKTLADPLFPTLPRLSDLVRYAEEREPAGTSAKLAALFLNRAIRGKTWPDDLDVTEERSLTFLNLGITELPDDALAGHLADFRRLAQQPAVRSVAPLALSKLHVFGAEAVPDLLGLMSFGLGGGDAFLQSKEHQFAFLSGLRGLCLAGPAAASALPQLQTWLQEKRLPLHNSLGWLLIQMLRRLDVDPEAIWPIYSGANPTMKKQSFEQQFVQRQWTKRSCDW